MQRCTERQQKACQRKFSGKKKTRKSGGNLVEAVQLPKTTPNLPK